MIPKFVYVASSMPTPNDVVVELNGLLSKFLWKGKDKVTRLSAITEFENGSLRMRLLKLTFQPGLKCCCDYMRFFSLQAWDEPFQPGQKPSPCNLHFHFKKISFRTRAEISAQLTGLKFAM